MLLLQCFREVWHVMTPEAYPDPSQGRIQEFAKGWGRPSPSQIFVSMATRASLWQISVTPLYCPHSPSYKCWKTPWINRLRLRLPASRVDASWRMSQALSNQCFCFQPIRLLQRYSEWSAAVHHCTSSAGSERSCTSRSWLVPERSRASCPEAVALVASGVPNQVQAGTGDVHHPHTSVPRLPDRFCTPLQLGDRHQLLCSTYEDEIWRQSFLCGRASRVEQFASGSSSRGQSTLF